MENCKAKGTLVVPEWKSAPFWPLLCSYDCPFLFPEFVKDFCYLPRSRDMFLPGRGSSLVYTNKKSQGPEELNCTQELSFVHLTI